MFKKISTGMYLLDKHYLRKGIKKTVFKLMTDHEIVSKLIKNDSKVLDYGCGNCCLFDNLKAKKVYMLGYDNDDRYIEIGKAKGYNVVNSLQNIREKFDYVTANQVVEHMNLEQLNKLFQESYKFLNRGGMLIISSLNPDELFVLRDIWDDPTHVRPYSIKSLNRAAEQFEFTLVKIIKHHMRMNPIKIFIDIISGFDVYSGFTIVFKKK